jgi:hypothetical protein
MQVPSREALLSELDTLGYGARLARVATLGRDARGTPALTELQSRLLSGDAYEACLALELARSARDEATLLRGLTHPSCLVRGRAAAYVGDFVRDDAAVERLLPELSPSVRRRVLKGVALARRGALASRLLPGILSRHGASEAALLLPALDAETVRGLLPQLGHVVRSWSTLVHRQPEVVLDFVRARLTAAPERERASLFTRYRTPLAVLTLRRSEAVLALVRELAAPDSLPLFMKRTLPRLARRHPEQLVALLTRPTFRTALLSEGLSAGLLRQAGAFSQEQRLALARALADAPHHLASFLGALPPSERSVLFAHAFEGTPPRLLPGTLFAALPHATRDAEAVRELGLREAQEDRNVQLTLLSLRAIEHAREPLQKAAFASKAEDRARALSLLVSSTGLSRRGMKETLTHLSRLKNEQDPVRLEVLTALSRVPVSVFTPEHLPGLEALVTYVVEARDTSVGTRSALQELAFRFIRAHAATPESPLFRFALDTLKRLAGQSGSLALPSLERDLPRGAEYHPLRRPAADDPLRQRAGELRPHPPAHRGPSAGARGRWTCSRPCSSPSSRPCPTGSRSQPSSTGSPRRARGMRGCASCWTGTRAPSPFPASSSTSTAPAGVVGSLPRGPVLKGRFTPSHLLGWVPPATDGFHRWLPRQQSRFVGLLLSIARDTGRSDFERVGVLHVLAHTQVVSVETLVPFLDSQHVPPWRPRSGRWRGWTSRSRRCPCCSSTSTETGPGWPCTRCPAWRSASPPRRSSTALGTLLSREKLRVTVHKEVLRLLGTFRFARSVALLRQQWDKPQLHRDVRIAVGHAARQLLDDDAAWELLEAMARAEDAYVAASLLEQPAGQLPEHLRPRYTALVLQVSRHPELTVRRQAFTFLPNWSAGMEEPVAREALGR